MLHSTSSELQPPASVIRLGLDGAMALAAKEMKRLGLDGSHRVGAFYAAPDLHTEGADFAATVIPRKDGSREQSKTGGARLKLLIQCDGSVSVCPFAKRCGRPCKVGSRS
jgi:hypothetical protein